MTVFLVEDSVEVRNRLRELLRSIAGLTIVGEAASPRDAITGIRHSRPDAVLLDLSLEGGSGFEVLRDIHPEFPDIVFMVITNNDSPVYAQRAAKLGAAHYFDKSLQQDELVSTLKQMTVRT